ncbi:hypothetical protein ACERJO_19975 [Halalkalibacter sp. AB-rgal2]|uniref:hypothetical protein n=1 Tax=Halalkalibacter sp. AB-rgal2 TaxID=3242695 RepID=UPI00359E3C72
MKNCIRCNKEIDGEFIVCFGGSRICENCLWKETEELFGRIGSTESSYEVVKHSYEGYKCLEVPVNAEELCKFIDWVDEERFYEAFDYNIFNEASDEGFLEFLEKEIKRLKLDMTVRELMKKSIRNAAEEELEINGWDIIILSHDEMIEVGLEHRLTECKAI